MIERATRKQLALILLLLALADLILLAPALFRSDLVRAPGDEIAVAMPFIRESGSAGMKSANSYLSDWAYSIHSWQRLVRSAYREGRMPLWNERAGCGQPLIGNLQAEIFSPYQPLNLLAGDNYVDWKQLAQLLVAQLSCLFLARVLGLSGFAAFVLAVGYSLGSYMQTWAVHPVAGSAAFAPAILGTFIGLRRGFSYGRLAATGLIMALSILAGHIESTFMACFAAAGVAFLAQGEGDGWVSGLVSRLKFSLLTAAAAGLGLALAAVTILPFFDYFDQSLVSSLRQAQGAVVVPTEHLLTVFDAKAFGFPTDAGGFHGFLNYITTTFHVGHGLLLLATVGLVGGLIQRQRFVLPLTLLVLFGMAVSHLDEMAQEQLDFFPFNLMPLLRMHYLASLLLPVLAAIGVDVLLREPGRWSQPVVFLLGVLLAAAGPIIVALGSFKYAPQIHALSLAYFGGATLLLLIVLHFRGRRPAPLALIAFGLLILAEAIILWRPFVPTVATELLSPKSEALAWLEEQQSEARLLPLVPNLPPETASLFDLHSLRSYDGMGMTRLTALLIHLRAYQGVVVDAPIVQVPRGVLDALGVRWTLTEFDPERVVGLYMELFVAAGSKGDREIPRTLKNAEVEVLVFRTDGQPVPENALSIVFEHASGRRIEHQLRQDPSRLQSDDLIGSFHVDTDQALSSYLNRAERYQKNEHHYVGMRMATTGEALKLTMAVAEDAPNMVVQVLARDGWNSQARFAAEGIHIGERESCPPMVHSSRAQLIVADDKNAILTLSRPDIDIKKTTILECDPSFLSGVAPRDEIEAIPFERPSPEEFQFQTNFDRPRVVVVQEMPARGWTARANGELLEMVPANVASMGIRVPAGAQNIVVRYSSKPLAWGLVISGLALLLVLTAPFVDRYLRSTVAKDSAN